MNILRIESSIFGDQGSSHALADRLIEGLSRNTSAQVVSRSLSNIEHFGQEHMTAAQKGAATIGDELIAEAEQADHIIITAPMYNFSIPSQLKAWLDHLARAGRTFKYGENGPQGLLTGKKVYVVTTRGGKYRDSDMDTQVPYLRIMLNFLGLAESLKFVYAEGLAMSDHKDEGLNVAREHIDAIIAEEAA
jgi:FMN-dependent NADH-azoreductase